tara:strand:- start:4264 stop:4491 length:228 start_codon:yes stop_codon:yes gene_type:complete
MGNTYVWLDKKLVHPTGPVLGLKIDDDFAKMSRYELCCHIEDKFRLDRNSFWELESTQKIRFCSQTARNILSKDD